MRYVVLISALIYMGCTTNPAAAPPATDDMSPRVVCANHPIPEFSLGTDSVPGEEQQAALCECIWSRLDQQDRKVAANLRQEADSGMRGKDSFPAHFGKAIRDCRAGA